MTIKGNGADPELLAASNIGKIDLLAAGSLVMTFFTPDLGTAVSSTIACLGNIGPGLNAVGAVENYAAIPNTGKMVLILLMLLGRLELFTVLVIFLPDFWRK
ncbi:MAG TPA: hypothetical protein ENN03_01265 [bacterium]|nr:hypothetical protein [bacterium]